MIISHSHRFLLLKSIKTAGTSVEAALSTFCGGDDVVTPLNKYAFNRDETSGIEHRDMNAHTLPWWNKEIGQHVDAATLKAHVSPEVWNCYLKVSIARNPWDRLVSLFTWRNKNTEAVKPKRRFYHQLGVPFDEFREVRKNFAAYARGEWDTNDRFYFLDGRLCADYVIRYESLEDSFAELCRLLGVRPAALPRLKVGIRSRDHHYSEWYDDDLVALVADRHRRDIETFGYRFEARAAA